MASLLVWDDNNLVSELLDFDCPLKTSFKQKAEDENKAPPGTSVC